MLVLCDACLRLQAAGTLSTAGPCCISPCFSTSLAASDATSAVNSGAQQNGFEEEGQGYGPLAGEAMIGHPAGLKSWLSM